MEEEQLKTLSSSYGHGFGIFVKRAPVLYEPTSGIDINRARLPKPKAMRNMQLAFREPTDSSEVLKTRTTARLLIVLVMSLAVVVGTILIGTFVPLETAAYIAPFLSVPLALVALFRRRARPAVLIGWLILPFVAFLAMKIIAYVISMRIVGTVVSGLITIVCFAFVGHRPFAFFREWVYAHPRLKPETRAHKELVLTGPRLRRLLFIIALLLVLPRISPSLALVTICGFCVFVIRRHLKSFRLFHSVVVVCGLFMTYGEGVVGAPGAWTPMWSCELRRKSVWLITVPLFLMLATSLYLFAPFDAFFYADYTAGYLSAADKASLYAIPYYWIELAVQGNHFMMIPVVLLFACCVPALVLTALFYEPLIDSARIRHRVESELDNDGRTEWQWYLDRLRTSHHEACGPLGERIREAEHLFLGVGPCAAFPVLLSRDVLKEHCYIVGETGSGKTSLGIMPILMQLIRGHADSDGAFVPPPAVVILDLKGDNALFQTVKHEMQLRRDQHQERNDITDPDDPTHAFRFFTPEKNMASHFFNPFDSFKSESRTDIQLCHLLLDALNLNHGEGYGRSYYSRRNRMLLFEALGKNPKSMTELYEILKTLTKQRSDPTLHRGETGASQDAFELVSTIHALTQYEMLATSANVEYPEQSIHMPQVIEKRQVAYFWLPAVLESISVREIGKLALFSLLTAAIDRQRRGEEPRQVFLVIDEFQRIAGENFKVILEQARSFGISVILANQTQSDLRTHDVDLRPTVRTNTRSKLFFGATDPEEIASLSEASGQELAFVRSETSAIDGINSPAALTESWTHALKPRLTPNDILHVTDHPLEFILHVSRGAGYTQFGGMPLIVRTTYPLTASEYKARTQEKWPKRTKHLLESQKSPKDLDREAAAVAHEELEELFATFDA